MRGSWSIYNRFYGGYPASCQTNTASITPRAPSTVFDFVIDLNFPASGIIQPDGTGGANSLTVVVRTQPATANQSVTLRMGAEMTESGGHVDHTGTRPVGSLAATQGTTNAGGTLEATYTASIFGGSYRVYARMQGMEKGRDIRVFVPGLQELGDGVNYNLRQVDVHHPAYHYGTATANTNLPLIAADYINTYYATQAATEEEKLVFNDQSLIYGGKFEILGDWGNGSHAEHREGKNCDVRSINVPAGRHAALEDIFRQRGSPNFLKHVPPDQPHWHLRF